jgi:excisionase family DNA binding protein
MQNEPEKNNPNLMSIGEASSYLNVSIDTLRRWEAKGKVNTYRSPGGHRYFKKDELRKLFGKRYKRYGSKPVNQEENITTDETAPNQFKTLTVDEFKNYAKEDQKRQSQEENENDLLNEERKDKDLSAHLTPSSVLDPIETRDSKETLKATTINQDEEPSIDKADIKNTENIKEDQKEKQDTHTVDTLSESNSAMHNPVIQHQTTSNSSGNQVLELEVYEPINETLKEQSLLNKTKSFKDVVIDKDEDTLSKLQKFIFGAFVAFLFADIILLAIWFFSSR